MKKIGNIIVVVVAILFGIGPATVVLYATLYGNQYFTESEVLAKIQEINPYAVALEKTTYRIFEPSLVTVKVRNAESEEYRVYSNIHREISIE